MSRKMSVVTVHFMHMGAVLLMLFVMVIVNLLASSSCKQLENVCRAREAELKKLEDEHERESARWAEMTTSENLEKALLANGLSMHPPKAAQIVRMRRDGTPHPAQLSLAKAEQRARAASTASASYGGKAKRRR
jgi:hypothetical protein